MYQGIESNPKCFCCENPRGYGTVLAPTRPAAQMPRVALSWSVGPVTTALRGERQGLRPRAQDLDEKFSLKTAPFLKDDDETAV